MHKRYLLLLLAILLIKALLLMAFIATGAIGLGPDEAQYWTWSRLLDWGYYSKPPGIAWQIAAGTSLFGPSELGVRFFSIIFSFLQAIVVYFLALKSELNPRTSFWCGLAMAFCPIGVFGSIFAITDGGFLLFWSLACLVLVLGLKPKLQTAKIQSIENQGADPLKMGLLIACGALFKWPIYAFWIIYILTSYFYFPIRNKAKFIAGVFLSLLGLLPSLWWNSQHNWATFRHVGATLQGGSGSSPASGNPLDFLGTQAALFSPVLLILVLLAAITFVREYRQMNSAVKVMGWTFMGGFSLFFALSFVQKIQGNWSLAIYPSAIILMGWYAETCFSWLKRGVFVSIALLTILAFTLYFSLIPHKMNPFKHNLGWNELNQQLLSAGYDPKTHFLVSDKYQTTSQISFYNDQQQRAYFMNLKRVRNNQYCYWPGLPEEQLGRSGYFVWVENAPHWHKNCEKQREYYLSELKTYFREVECQGCFPLMTYQDEILKGALIFKCTEYNGQEPAKTEHY